MVFVGVPHPPTGDWPVPPYTKVAVTPIVREMPYLQVDAANHWTLQVPPLRRDATGVTWNTATPSPNRAIPFSAIYIAHSDHDTAATINEQLAHGKNLLLTPGIYELTEPLHVTQPNTCLLYTSRCV